MSGEINKKIEKRNQRTKITSNLRWATKCLGKYVPDSPANRTTMDSHCSTWTSSVSGSPYRRRSSYHRRRADVSCCPTSRSCSARSFRSFYFQSRKKIDFRSLNAAIKHARNFCNSGNSSHRASHT